MKTTHLAANRGFSKIKQLMLTLSISISFGNLVFATSCVDNNPSGPQAVIECLASNAGTSAENYWNTVLFNKTSSTSTNYLDNFCQLQLPVNSTTAQQEMYNKSCTSEAGSYFSYANFIAADQAIALSNVSNSYTFMRIGDFAAKTREFANFLATLSQETTGGAPYTNTGLYFRYENTSLAADGCYSYPANPYYTAPGAGRTVGSACSTKGLAQYYTNYYPPSVFAIAESITDPTQIYTGYQFQTDIEYNFTQTPVVAYTPAGGYVPIIESAAFPNLSYISSPIVVGTSINWGTTPPSFTYMSSGVQWQFLNQILQPGYWIGIGNLQLTGGSMMEFFGWYQQNLASGAPVQMENLQNFVELYLQNGQLAWEGGLWYWNFRVNGINRPTLHSVLTSTNPQLAACHDIGITTWIVNGGCNDSTQRVQYFQHFAGTLFHLDISGIPFGSGGHNNSMYCSAALGANCGAPL